MNREDCIKVEQRLVFPGARIELQCDAYRLTMEVQRDKMRMVVMIYVDGFFKGLWMRTDCEERRRFLRPIIHRPKPYTGKQMRVLGKKWCDEQRIQGTFTYYSPVWLSSRALLRHLHKHNSSVELVVPAEA